MSHQTRPVPTQTVGVVTGCRGRLLFVSHCYSLVRCWSYTVRRSHVFPPGSTRGHPHHFFRTSRTKPDVLLCLSVRGVMGIMDGSFILLTSYIDLGSGVPSLIVYQAPKFPRSATLDNHLPTQTIVATSTTRAKLLPCGFLIFTL